MVEISCPEGSAAELTILQPNRQPSLLPIPCSRVLLVEQFLSMVGEHELIALGSHYCAKMPGVGDLLMLEPSLLSVQACATSVGAGSAACTQCQARIAAVSNCKSNFCVDREREMDVVEATFRKSCALGRKHERCAFRVCVWRERASGRQRVSAWARRQQPRARRRDCTGGGVEVQQGPNDSRRRCTLSCLRLNTTVAEVNSPECSAARLTSLRQSWQTLLHNVHGNCTLLLPECFLSVGEYEAIALGHIVVPLRLTSAIGLCKRLGFCSAEICARSYDGSAACRRCKAILKLVESLRFLS
eukprot:6184809-Pleurochrysis_carterae.AAC.1